MRNSQLNGSVVRQTWTSRGFRLLQLAREKVRPLRSTAILLVSALALNGRLQAGDLPRLSTGHVDIGINYEDGAWDLHVHAEELGLEYAPGQVWLKAAASSRTAVPSAQTFGFLGTPGTSIWMLPAVQRPDLLFLGLGTEELESGVFQNDSVRLALKSVQGPGDVISYHLDSFGTPVVSFNSRDGIGAEDVRSLPAGSHTHLNWVFTAPGQYRVGLEASGVLAATGEATGSGIAEYLFEVADLPWLALTKEIGHDHLHLEWPSETNASYQIQRRLNMAGSGWTNVGNLIPGTGGVLLEHLEPAEVQQFFRVLVDYNPASNHGQYHPGIAAGLGRIYVTDPVGQTVLELDTETLRTQRTFPLAGAPTKVSTHGVLVPRTRP